jgi:hypothetical protein
VVVSCPLNDDDRILNVAFLLGLANPLHDQLEANRSVLQRLGFDEQVSKVISHHPFGPMLGWIDADDGEPLTAHLLDAGSDNAVGLLQRLVVARLGLAKLPASDSSYVVRHLDSP